MFAGVMMTAIYKGMNGYVCDTYLTVGFSSYPNYTWKHVNWCFFRLVSPVGNGKRG